MKRFVSVLACAAALTFAVTALAEKAAAPAKSTTLKGEIVDLGCYLGQGARGEKHKSCALKCAANGMPIGLLTAQGKLYLLTPDHDNADPFNKAKEMAGSNAAVTGTIMQRNGVTAIDVTGISGI